MDRRAVVPIGIGLLLVVTAVPVVLAGASGTNSNSGNGTQVSVSAGASTTAAADLAVVSVSVVERARTADAARMAVAEGVADLRESLSAAGIGEDAVSTSGYRLRAEYSERELRGYVATQSFEVEAPDVDSAGVVIDAAVSGGATQVDGVAFTLSEQRRQELRTDSLAVAMDRARADADAVAEAAGLAVTGVETISTGGDSPVTPVFADAERVSADTAIDPGPVTVSVSVSVTYLAA